MDEQTGCPADYEELFREYFPMMCQIVARSGIQYEEVEDVAMDLLAKFIEIGGIAYYDPEHLHDTGENPDLPGPRLRKAKFKGMLRGFTATYVMQSRDKQMIRQKYFPWRLDKVVTMEDEKIEFYDTFTDNNLDSTETAVCILSAIKRARPVLVSNSTPSRDYGQFMDVAIEYGLLDGKLDRKAIKAEMGISDSVLAAMLKDLRSVMRPMLVEVGVVKEAM